MNLNILSYSIYLTITAIIIFIVGQILYRNGNVFVSQLVPNHENLCKKVNKNLLLGYYLLNLGYCAITILSWEKIETVNQLVRIIAYKTSIILFIIGILHYLNIFMITNYIKKLIN
jgi:hypothetical protein